MAAEEKVFSNYNNIDYPDANLLQQVRQQLYNLPPLLAASEINQLQEKLTDVFYGNAFVIQAGDCAERFTDAEQSVSHSKFNHLIQLKSQLESRLNKSVIPIGRIAGQYAKPRSDATELVNGKWVHVYHGDMINGESTQHPRSPNPLRILKAYDSAKAILSHRAEFKDTFFTSHEAFLLEYEQPLTREENRSVYNLSTHFPWLGMRNISSEAHLQYLSMIDNPIALKIGPQTPLASILAAVRKINPKNQPGKVTLVLRLGASKVSEVLPRIIHVIRENQFNVVWMSDPLHGNTQYDKYKRKFRMLSDAVQETTEVCHILNKYGAHLGGVHLEATYKENVLECVSTFEELTENRVYDSALDPRLNRMQCENYIDQTVEKISAQYA